MIGSSLVLSWEIVQDGVMRRSEEEAVEVMRSGMSLVEAMDGCMVDLLRANLMGLVHAICGGGVSVEVGEYSSIASPHQPVRAVGKNCNDCYTYLTSGTVHYTAC